MQTFQENKEGFKKRNIKDAEKSRSEYNMVGHPSAADFERMVRGNMLRKFPITDSVIKNVHTIFGPDVGSLRRKTVRKKTETVTSKYVAIPEQIKEKMKIVEVIVDVVFINKIPFVVSLGKCEVFHNRKRGGSEIGCLVKMPL